MDPGTIVLDVVALVVALVVVAAVLAVPLVMIAVVLEATRPRPGRTARAVARTEDDDETEARRRSR